MAQWRWWVGFSLFSLPMVSVGHEPGDVSAFQAMPDDVADGSDAGTESPLEARPAMETVVSGKRAYTAASSATVRNEDFLSRPIAAPADILEVTPGLFTIQHAGGGKANQYFLRGFDNDHGTDLALSVDGVPINMVSHAHGQGYADLHFIIPETIEKLEVTKGPYSAEQADFATSGSVNLISRRAFQRSSASLGYGSFNTFRALLVAAPQFEERVQSYVVGEVYGSNGPFLSPERLRRFNLSGRASYVPSSSTELSLQLQSYGSGWNASGQIPLRAVEAGTLSRFGTLDASEGGNSQRHSAQLSFHHHSPEGGEIQLMAYLARYRLNLFSNFTFFSGDPVRGDQIEQADSRVLAGFEARYERRAQWRGIDFKSGFGIRLRNDDIEAGLFHAEKRERLEPRVQAGISEAGLGLFAEEDVDWTRWLRTVVGLRADGLGFQVTDRLEDLSSTGTVGSGVAHAVLLSPKATVVLMPHRRVDIFLNFGRGFHSNDARGVVRRPDPASPLAVATGAEVGLRVRALAGLELAAAAWGLDLESETVWVGDEGTTEVRPASRRLGLEVELRYRLLSWLRADVDFTWTKARFLQPTGGGTSIPLAPEWTWAGGVQADHRSGLFGSLRFHGMGDRPANEDRSLVATGWTLLDLQLGWQTKHVRLALEARNLLNSSWRQAQFANESQLAEETVPQEDLHFTPGYPLRIMGTATAYF